MDRSADFMNPVLIDFSILSPLNSSSSQEAWQLEFRKFRNALTSRGFFQLINHGIPSEFLEDMIKISRQFFTLPIEEKQKHAILAGGKNGYSSGATLGSTSTQHDGDWNEALSLTVYPVDRRENQFWPQKPHELKKMLHESTMKFAAIFESIFKMVLQSMGIDEVKFAEQYGKNKEINTRLNLYPKCPSPDQLLGQKSHSDFSALTILVQDEAGLQVQNQEDGEWYMVPVIPDALFVSIGDTIEIMSNGIVKSVVHRVVTNGEKSRMSLVMFWDSDRDCEIGPLDELITADRPPLYKNISHKDYSTNFYSYYQAHQRPMDFIRR